MKEDGFVVTWGNKYNGGDSSSVAGQLKSGVKEIYSTYSAFAALKEDGSIVTWGNKYNGGDSSSVAGQLKSGVKEIYSTYSAFAALKEDGSVVTWGAKSYGGDSSSVVGLLKSGVKEIYSNSRAFAAVKEDGSVITWGDKERGGEMARVSLFGTVLSSVTGQLKSGVKMIYPTDNAFAALKEDGSVITWGRVDYGRRLQCSSRSPSGWREGDLFY